MIGGDVEEPGSGSSLLYAIVDMNVDFFLWRGVG